MPYAKPYLSVPDQIALLTRRGMAVPDPSRAKHCLTRIGYYRLSGYWFPFKEQNPAGGVLDTFKPNTSFETVIALYYFDKNLRMLMLDAIERIEIALRVHISLHLGQKSPLAHRDPQLLDGTFSKHRSTKTNKIPHQDWLARTDEEFNRSKEEFVKHFKSRYPNEHPPIWIACEVWGFGSLSHLFGGLTKADQNVLAREFGVPNGNIFEKWIIAINVARNACAHHSRVWNRPSGVQPRWPQPGAAPELAHIANNVRGQTRVYGTLAILRYLLRSINPATGWSVRLKGLCATFPVDPSLSLSSGGFPQNWDQEHLWA